MTENSRFVVCDLEGRTIAFRLENVERLVRMVSVTAAPAQPANMLGLVNFSGTIIPVVSLSRAFEMPERPLLASDQLLIARVENRLLGVPVNCTYGVTTVSDDMIVKGRSLGPSLLSVEGVFANGREIIHILDLAAFLGIDAWEIAARVSDGQLEPAT
jgi:purine-binding chemotaxis protein CheW